MVIGSSRMVEHQIVVWYTNENNYTIDKWIKHLNINLNDVPNVLDSDDEYLKNLCNKLLDMHSLVYTELQSRKLKHFNKFVECMIESNKDSND